MSCNEWRSALLRAADNEPAAFDAAQGARLAEHLQRCASCREELAGQQAVRAALAARADAPLPAGFAARVLAGARIGPRWMDVLPWRIWTYRLAPVAAALLVAAGLAAFRAAGPPATGNVSELADVWTYGAAESDELPAYALLGQDGVSGDRLLDAILSAAPDETLVPGDQS